MGRTTVRVTIADASRVVERQKSKTKSASRRDSWQTERREWGLDGGVSRSLVKAVVQSETRSE